MTHILVIDDDKAIRDMLYYFLTRNEYSVALADDGAKGAQSMAERMPDLVITDMLMPGEDGLELLRRVRKRFPAVKVIAISGGIRDANYDPLPIAQMMGACCTFTKPLDLNELLSSIQRLLGES